MKSEDLMVGDWVKCTYPAINKCLRVAEIKTVADDELKVVLFDDVRLVFPEKYIDPIPLTPEILEKNGFSQDPLNGHIFIFQKKSGEVIYYEYGPKYGLTIDNQLATIQDLKIKYVHEFQRALRCVGLFDLANNIKI